MKKISVTLAGHRTSITLENEFFIVLKKIAEIEKISVAEIIQKIDAKNGDGKTNLSSAVRVWVLQQVLKTTKL